MGFRTDLVWIILSAAVGWAYLALILGVGSGLENPIRDPFATMRIGEFALPLSLGLVVVASWAIVLDAPHLFATLARTVLDPEEWRVRGGVLLASFGFFLLGPALILTPRWLSSAGVLPVEAATLGSVVFLVFFRLWPTTTWFASTGGFSGSTPAGTRRRKTKRRPGWTASSSRSSSICRSAGS